jgi:signal transduction histidine kinase
VEVVLECDGDGLRLAVRDSGPGISPEDQARVFEPFERGARASDEFVPGVGLGLAVVRDLAKAIGARVELRSEPDRGSVFTVVLPIRLRGRPVEATRDARGRNGGGHGTPGAPGPT